MNHNETIAVIQAQRDGKQIEAFLRNGGERWFSVVPSEGFDFQDYTYRVKPEPREWWIAPNGENGYGGPDVISERARRGLIHVREVL